MSYTVLIVDDSTSMRKVITKVLRLSGFKVNLCFEAANGLEALDVLDHHWVDLILSDIHMPVMDGFGLLQALQEKDVYQDLPVVLVTTEGNSERLQKALALGAKGYVRKPFRPEAIRSLLLQVMGEADEHGVATGDEGCDF